MSQRSLFRLSLTSHLRHFLLPLFLRVTLLATPVALLAEEVSPAHPVILIGGAYEKPPIHSYLEGSKHTILYPATISDKGECTPLPPDRRFSSNDWDHFIKESQERTSLLLATLDPVMVRDRAGIIQMAVLTADNPMVASCILSRGFRGRFTAIFGPELIIAIPARNKLYVFPKLANRLPSAIQTILDDYLISPMPVSNELFELSDKGLHAIGTLDPEDGR